ncbi:DUF4031 domain-containing protein [Nocardioides sp. zg-536]|uniref:DUF4031 domain-containing protein n=1 Tax=Nocardioides faecalis TaxID=2803858 RepID=A0A938Y4F4_9ACTN|nr:DUF4031 domain-containing protein [Nocardioides faecalis]MBM9461701.1 DUF4031 domain-containing protein [Nocardioides faecalis]QVI59074.1 DUF4031 domain-containing protein [Nocardioides faecalis]
MTIHVDDMQLPARVGRMDGVWSHLLSDLPGAAGHDELVAFAARLGIEARWIQNEGTATEHFDLTEPLRQRALALGAVPVRYGRAVAAITRAKREHEASGQASGQAPGPATGFSGR